MPVSIEEKLSDRFVTNNAQFCYSYGIGVVFDDIQPDCLFHQLDQLRLGVVTNPLRSAKLPIILVRSSVDANCVHVYHRKSVRHNEVAQFTPKNRAVTKRKEKKLGSSRGI